MNTLPNIQTGNVTSGSHISYWTDTFIQNDSANKPVTDQSADVVIVGAGIAGLTTAYCLVKAGKKVIVVEDGLIGSGETGRTTAHLVSALDDRYYELERIFGDESMVQIAKSHADAIDFIERTVIEENIDCDFKRVDGYLFLHESDKEESLQKEFDATKKAGLDTELLDTVPGIASQKGGCIRFKKQGQFHPMKYLGGLSRFITGHGGVIYTYTHAKEVSKNGIVTEEGIKISAGHVVVATNTPVNNLVVMHLKQYPFRTYVVGALIRKGLVPEALWWDTGDMEANKTIPPYHYVRLQPYDDKHDLIICGGEDHPTGLPEEQQVDEMERYALLESWLRKRFPAGNTIYRWSGQVLEPMDSLAFIGVNPLDSDNIYIITGDSGNGMTHGTIAGQLITDLITGKENPLARIYNPSRFKFLSSGLTFIKQLTGGLAEYIKTYPRYADSVKLSRIAPGQAAVAELNGDKYGVYRDEANALHLVSASCTHMHCTIKWNNDERTWDCPCHGSRFTYKGNVINGPANKDLDYFTDAEKITNAVHH